jgi:hypothetical protein
MLYNSETSGNMEDDMVPMIAPSPKPSRVEQVWTFLVGVGCVGLVVSLGTAAFYPQTPRSGPARESASCTRIDINSGTGAAVHSACFQPALCTRFIPTPTSCLAPAPPEGRPAERLSGGQELADIEINYLNSLLLMVPVSAKAPFSAYLLAVDGVDVAAWASAEPEPPEYELARYSVEYYATQAGIICGQYACDECANFVQSNISLHDTAQIYLIQQQDRYQIFHAGAIVQANTSHVVSRTSIAYTGLDHITLFDTSSPACPRIRNMPLYLSQHTTPTGVMVLFMDAYIETVSSLYHGNTPIL